MARTNVAVEAILRIAGIRPQFLEAVDRLRETLESLKIGPGGGGYGKAYRICDIWQRRFELALRSEIPEWNGLAAFRCITDFVLTDELLRELLGDQAEELLGQAGEEGLSDKGTSQDDELEHGETSREPAKETQDDCPQELTDQKLCQLAFRQFFLEGRELYSGKLFALAEIQNWFLERLNDCEQTLGGQAGNILWLWNCIGMTPRAYVPYLTSRLTEMHDRAPGLGDVRVLQFKDGRGELRRLEELTQEAGVRKSGGEMTAAPSGGSFVAVRSGRRLIYQIPGFRVLGHGADNAVPWTKVRFSFPGEGGASYEIERKADDSTWPSIPLFCECWIDESTATLEIEIVPEEEVAKALKGQVDYAVMGGLDALYRDSWLKEEKELQLRLLNAAERQLAAMGAAGIRIGLELSGVPGPEYAQLVKRLCQQEVVVVLGINGVDELRDTVGKKAPDHTLWLDLATRPEEVRNTRDVNDEHFEYLTYLRARKLAEATGVRTLYVHTMSLDLILRRDADPGALLRAQLGDMMGKGLVLVALLKRAYGEERWLNEMEKMPPAARPGAMAALARFARDFEEYEQQPGSLDRLLTSGYWLGPSRNDYSVAVCPVMWPEVTDERAAEILPGKMNPTGAGDMTFGSFVILSGV